MKINEYNAAGIAVLIAETLDNCYKRGMMDTHDEWKTRCYQTSCPLYDFKKDDNVECDYQDIYKFLKKL